MRFKVRKNTKIMETVIIGGIVAIIAYNLAKTKEYYSCLGLLVLISIVILSILIDKTQYLLEKQRLTIKKVQSKETIELKDIRYIERVTYVGGSATSRGGGYREEYSIVTTDNRYEIDTRLTNGRGIDLVEVLHKKHNKKIKDITSLFGRKLK